ncbi:MAG TPA: DUF2254 domain-containing protein [Candidatus Dormibacteraeota bacterium]|jgi:uncharacterized membrane protein|nr:DUF2254 domain-containing protein [Candidatus Dormibacteraeota bacterium]
MSPGPRRIPFLAQLWRRVPSWRREALRTNLWLVPSALMAAVLALFVATYLLDRAVYAGRLALPAWINTGGADSGRQVLGTIAAAVITVVGVVFSIVILALQLASTQFGPRMLRNFVRDLGTQVTLGIFVATFVFSVVTLGSISSGGRRPDFVPHFSISVALALLVLDLIVLIYFIHHVAVTIQLNEVVAGIGRDLVRAVDEQSEDSRGADPADPGDSDDPADWTLLEGADVPARRSGYLQAISHESLVRIAARAGAAIELLHRPGHFLVEGRPLARVLPASAAPAVTAALERAHVTGRQRTLTQDPVFAIDQLVEIAIRALSPAVNDTYTAIACIDWLTAGLCHFSGRVFFSRVHRDAQGFPRVVQPGLSYARVVNGAFDKVRQAGRGMPAVAIRQLASLARIMEYTVTAEQREVLLRQADMIRRGCEETVPEPEDLLDVRRRHQDVVAAAARMDSGARPHRPAQPRLGRRGPRPSGALEIHAPKR